MVGWVADHLILLALLIAVGVVCLALVALAIIGVRAWRTTRAAVGRAGSHVSGVTSSAEALQTRMEVLSRGGEDLTIAREELSRQVAVLKVIGAHLARALAVFRAPLRAIGR